MKQVPDFKSVMSGESLSRFENVLNLLKSLDIPVTINSRLVRGLDYYNHTTFEIIADGLGSQNAICGGGRYDTLVKTMGGPNTPAIGFAFGIDRLQMILESQNKQIVNQSPHVYICALNKDSFHRCF